MYEVTEEQIDMFVMYYAMNFETGSDKSIAELKGIVKDIVNAHVNDEGLEYIEVNYGEEVEDVANTIELWMLWKTCCDWNITEFNKTNW